jgi:hypothetical protein
VTAVTRSPKSVALPVVAKVNFSILFVCAVSYPPIANPLIASPPPLRLFVPAVKSPKSVALPVDAIVIY